MRIFKVLLLCFLTSVSGELQVPRVVIGLLVRNKEPILPHSLYGIENLEYPKDRISLFIRSDNNVDESETLLIKWITRIQSLYHDVNFKINQSHENHKESPLKWSEKRYERVINYKEEALAYSQTQWSDYLWILDADVIISNNQTLKLLTSESNFILSAPLLISPTTYSNFWASMSDSFYYKHDELYDDILSRKNIGCFSVPMIHSSILLNLNFQESKLLSFHPKNIPNYKGPFDDVIAFALSAQTHGIPLHICNNHIYGYIMVPLVEDIQSLEDDLDNLSDLRLEALNTNSEFLPYLQEFKKYIRFTTPHVDLPVDKYYMINLDRRPDRKHRMKLCFQELGLNVERISAVDGKTIDEKYMRTHGIQMMEGYLDPYHQRPLKYGEIGCFMSHYTIWRDMIINNIETAIIFEDDIRFVSKFSQRLKELFEEIQNFDYDLIFLGRKMLNRSEKYVEDFPSLVHVEYSYWTLGYILTKSGAQKLIDEKPLGKMIPVDEYIPIMYDKHPNDTWKRNFGNRNLKAFSVEPLYVQPTHYIGQEGYISDTENTPKIKDEL